MSSTGMCTVKHRHIRMAPEQQCLKACTHGPDASEQSRPAARRCWMASLRNHTTPYYLLRCAAQSMGSVQHLHSGKPGKPPSPGEWGGQACAWSVRVVWLHAGSTTPFHALEESWCVQCRLCWHACRPVLALRGDELVPRCRFCKRAHDKPCGDNSVQPFTPVARGALDTLYLYRLQKCEWGS